MTLILALVSTGLAKNVELNLKFAEYLNGSKPLYAYLPYLMYSLYDPVHSHEKSYQRFRIFKQTLLQVIAHNSLGHSWEMGINDYSDMTWEQFKNIRLMAPQNCSATYNLKVKDEVGAAPIPPAFDWRSFGMVSPVKNQGSCGSCWTFSTIGAIQSHQNILRRGRNMTFSEQQLVDCAGDFDNHGCEGGLPSHAFEYIRYAGGIQGQDDYPYTAKDGKCVFDASKVKAHVPFGSYNITAGNQTQLMQRLFSQGPVSVAFQVYSDFRNYKSGVYSSTGCKNGVMDVNHAVLAVGYGTENGKKFWTIKNSWGTTWGDNGFFKMERDVNMCGVAQCNSYPLIINRQMESLQLRQ